MTREDADKILEQMHWIKVAVQSENRDYMRGWFAAFRHVEGLIEFLGNGEDQHEW